MSRDCYLVVVCLAQVSHQSDAQSAYEPIISWSEGTCMYIGHTGHSLFLAPVAHPIIVNKMREIRAFCEMGVEAEVLLSFTLRAQTWCGKQVLFHCYSKYENMRLACTSSTIECCLRFEKQTHQTHCYKTFTAHRPPMTFLVAANIRSTSLIFASVNFWNCSTSCQLMMKEREWGERTSSSSTECFSYFPFFVLAPCAFLSCMRQSSASF